MTNPPVPATPLDVEACVRLLEEAKSLLADRARNRRRAAGEAEHSAEGFQWLALANQDDELVAVAGALALALPGMGKAEERLRRIREQCRVIYYGTTDMYPIEHAPGANKDSWEWMMLHLDADAARAAQPEETSADAV